MNNPHTASLSFRGDGHSLLIAGDVCPINANESLFREATRPEDFGNDWIRLFQRASYSIANLECPLIESPSPMIKTGTVIGAPRETAVGLSHLGLKAVSLANNHIMDHGTAGLATTMDTLQRIGIEHFGAGDSAVVARRQHEFTLGANRVIVFSAAEHEFSIAGPDTPGANGLDPARLVLDVHRAAEAGKFVVVLLHAGKEYHPYPSPALRGLCAVLVEAGARCIVCQHSHCMGAIERLNEGIVFYGQGNFLFDWHTRRPASWYEGSLIELNIGDSGEFDFQLHGVQAERGRPGTRLLASEESSAIRERLCAMGERCSDPLFLEGEWRRLCDAKAALYFAILRGHGRIRRALGARMGWVPVYKGEELTTLINVIRCESHREVLLTILEQAHAARKGS